MQGSIIQVSTVIQPLQLEFLEMSPLNIIQVSTVIQPQQKNVTKSLNSMSVA